MRRDRNRNQTPHEKQWRFVHPAIREFFTNAITSYRDTSANQNFIGAEAMAFERQMLPLYEWKGPGEVVYKQLIAGQQQVYVQQTVVPTGIAGIGAGQIWNGGLVDNPSASDTLAGEVV